MFARFWTGPFCTDEIRNVAQRLSAVQKEDDAVCWSVGIVLVGLDIGWLAIFGPVKVGVGAMIDLRDGGTRSLCSLFPRAVGDVLSFDLFDFGSV